MTNFKQSIIQGIPKQLPEYKGRNADFPHAPKRANALNEAEKQQAVQNALSYFPRDWRDMLR
jgi:urocanate hydratase